MVTDPEPGPARGLTRALWAPVDSASLTVFRIWFGLLGALGAARFWWYGWIESLYVLPPLRFTYWGFDWVPRPGAPWIFLLFGVMGVSALAVAVGWRTRAACVLYALCFVWVELLDVTTYLNHYYLIGTVSLMLCLLPVTGRWSLDGRRDPALRITHIPAWMLWALRVQLGMVYVYASIAKMHPDWMWYGQPLYTWLQARSELPVVGGLFELRATAIAMSWGGLLFDLVAPFLLLWRRTRPWMYAVVVGFHLVTWALFPIGLFPWVMMGSATLFFAPDWPRRVRSRFFVRSEGASGDGAAGAEAAAPEALDATRPWRQRAVLFLFIAHLLVQLALPWRHLLYPGDVRWTEEGFRFSWRVMLVEKGGDVQFRVVDPETGRRWVITPRESLTPLQEKMMSTQPDLILQHAHHIAARFRARGVSNPQVFADAWVSWNGRRATRLIDPTTDLASVRDTLSHKPWLLPAPGTPPR